MRATGTLAAFCVLFGASAFCADTVQAAERNPRTAQKQARPGQVAVTPPRPPATASQASRIAAAKPAQQASRQAAASQARGTQVAALPPPPPPAPATRVRVLNEMPSASPAPSAPLQLASAAMLRPAFASPAVAHPSVGAGTPIQNVSIGSGLSCVPFARMATGMNISGDARMWWYNAAGAYARGNAPERGSVLAFTASGGMSRGHVAVVSRVVNSRTIHIDHANWGGPGIRRGAVMRGVVVVDASDRNDWTAVRVQVGHDDSAFGRTYSTHGFIYNRPLSGADRMMEARARAYEEVAEGAPSPHVAQHLRLTSQLFAE